MRICSFIKKGSNNGKPDDFNEVDKETLRNALLDISQKLSNVAENLR